MSNGVVSYGFRCGADMDPVWIRKATPEARFIARARLTEGRSPFESAGASDDELSDTWGILVCHPASTEDVPADGRVITDDGRTFDVRISTETKDVANHAETVAAARYWELPPEYVRQLTAIDLTE